MPNDSREQQIFDAGRLHGLAVRIEKGEPLDAKEIAFIKQFAAAAQPLPLEFIEVCLSSDFRAFIALVEEHKRHIGYASHCAFCACKSAVYR